ncbi:MAG: ABC transporter ATP-binding protein [Desulfomonile tiedjei]|uniref:ABC transporter ATP-binding protein n=1 Tax=Desulfomonile tiedjei TaxID=2358 RepID=A0A9D6UY74_9BACT|nr:ABC transporter ATP-binding protein [Desulfomonile tiedjei]
MSGDVVIKIEGLWKRYGLPMPELVSKALNLVRRGSQENGDRRPWALKDLNLEIRKGETVGIIGRNGAGKSTLLKVLAGVSEPTKGRVEIHGRIFPMIELNAGLHMELTGRENVKLLAAVMGLSRKEIDAKLPDIEDFTELGDWFDKPVRMYSSGMLGRLGFGVAVNMRSDVILIDETFAVGDLRFQNKSLARVKEMREGGSTVLLVSHSLETLQFVARHGILLEEGAVIASGTALETINAYETLVFRSEQKRLEHKVRNSISSEEVNIFSARIYGNDDRTLTEIRAGEPFGIEVDLRLNRSLERPTFSLGILNAAGILCKWNISAEDGMKEPGSCDRYLLRAWYPENHFSNGAYEVRFAVRDGASSDALDRITGILSFAVTGPGRARGLVAGKCKWQLLPQQCGAEKTSSAGL